MKTSITFMPTCGLVTGHSGCNSIGKEDWDDHRQLSPWEKLFFYQTAK